MKKSYITPEKPFREAEAWEPLCASQEGNGDFVLGGGQGGNQNYSGGEVTSGYGGNDDFVQGAKPGDFFCDNFEYDFDF